MPILESIMGPSEMVDETGKAMLEELAGSPAADRALAKVAVERAIADRDMSRPEAERIYGLPTEGQTE